MSRELYVVMQEGIREPIGIAKNRFECVKIARDHIEKRGDVYALLSRQTNLEIEVEFNHLGYRKSVSFHLFPFIIEEIP